MPRPSAIHAALDLVRSPVLAPAMRRHPLPPGVLDVIKIAAGSDEATNAAAAATGRTRRQLREVAVFYVRQILFSSRDPYRVLGVAPGADSATVAENARWLMKWLHPDSGGSRDDQADARKVLDAWTELKSPERRRMYDRRRAATGRRPPRPPMRRVAVLDGAARLMQQSRGLSWRTYAATAVVAVIALTGLVQLLS